MSKVYVLVAFISVSLLSYFLGAYDARNSMGTCSAFFTDGWEVTKFECKKKMNSLGE